MKSGKLLVLVAFILGTGLFVFGQTAPSLENGFKSFGSYHSGDIDTVNLQTGNLTFHVPLLSYPQRGARLNSNLVLMGGSKNWHVGEWTDRQQITHQKWMLGQPAGVAIVDPSWFELHRSRHLTTDFSGNQTYTMDDYAIATGDGSWHWLIGFTPSNNMMTADGSGIQLVVSPGTRVDHSDDRATVIFRDGTRYAFSNISVPMPAQGQGSSVGGRFFPPELVFDTWNTTQTAYDVALSISTVAVDSNGNVLAPSFDTLGRSAGSITQISDYSNCATTSRSITSAEIWNYPGPDGRSFSMTVCYTTFTPSAAFSQPNVDPPSAAATVEQIDSFAHGIGCYISSIMMPDGNHWSFDYDNFGNVTRIGLPTGGNIVYQWTEVPNQEADGSATRVSRAVHTRTVNDNNGHSYLWTYTWGSLQTDGTITNYVLDPNGNETAHKFQSLLSNQTSFYETETRIYQGDHNGTLLKTVDTTYYADVGATNSMPWGFAVNVVPLTITTKLANGLVSQVVRQYGGATGNTTYGKVTDEKVYDYGNGAPGALLRETATTYQWQNNSDYLDAGLLDLPATVIVKDGAGCALSETEYAYDEAAYLTSYTGTLPNGTHGNAPGGTIRGNLTTVTRWLAPTSSCNPSGGTPVRTHTNWYDTGEVYQQSDPLGHTTTHSYDSYYAGAYSTKTCNVLNHCVSGTYDLNTGLLESFTDENAATQASGNTPGDSNHTSNYSYDNMLRLTSAQFPPDAAGHRPQTTFTYSTPNVFPLTVQRQKSITTATNDVATAYFDGLGRSYQTQHVTPNGNVKVDTTYDGLEQVVQVTNPYFATTDTTYGVVQTQYDGLGRVTQTTEQDGSVASVSYTDNCTTSTDEAGKSRKSCSDGLGRLTAVWEDPAGLNYETDYQYDALGNLLTVKQHGGTTDQSKWRVRTFTYDSLSRLLTANNPESGTITYSYDADSNVISKTDARGVVTNYSPSSSPIDALHRITQITYSDGTPTRNFTYDEVDPWVSNTIGRRSGEFTSVNGVTNGVTHKVFSYDEMGRLNKIIERTTGMQWVGNVTASYDLAGNMTSLTYPDGQVVNYAYDSASRALSTIDGSNSTQYVSSATYWANGAVNQWLHPSNIRETVTLNQRLQVASQSADHGSYYFDRSYNYGTQGANNGNILSITNNLDVSRSQTFIYDGLNRLTHAENAGTNCSATLPDGHTEYWGNTYVYDAWGNLLQKNVTKCSAENLQVTAAANNRLVGYSYDTAGNMLNDGIHQYRYDAESRIAQVDSGATTYTYDADGERVRKDVGTSFTEYIEFGGNVMAERSPVALNSSMLSQSGLSAYNPGLIVDGSTACCARHTDSAVAGAWLQVDLGAGTAEAVLQARIYTEPSTVPYAGNWTVQYSDDGSAWNAAATNFVPSPTGWNSITWSSVGIHRWWRLYLSNTPGPGAWLDELQLVGETNYVYFNGKRTARRDPSGAIHYYLGDHLGSTSMVVSAAGAVENESEYYPWGGELKFSAADAGNHYKFTGKERDTESGLDYFGARYYGNTLGRFLTPDWAAKPVAVPYAVLGDPQSLNLYSYVRNIPTSLVDGDGHGWWSDFASGVYESTVGPIVQTVAHPINTVVGVGKAIGHTVAHPIDTAKAVGRGTVAFGKAVAHGDGKAIGQVVGTVVSTVATGGAVKAVSTLSKGAEVAETANLATRAGEVHSVLDPIAQEMRTTAALGTKEGTTVIAGGARDLTPAQRAALKPGEIAAKSPGDHAEITALKAAEQNGLTPKSLASTRTICDTCKAAIEKSGGTVTGKTAEWK